MSRPRGDLSAWMETYRKRSSLDPLRAVLDPGDEDNQKNEYLDAVERVHLRRALGGRRARRAVDLGCGAGRLLGVLADHAATVVGLDASADLLAAGRARALPPNVRLARGDLREIPLAPESIDLVLTCQSLIHVVEDDDLDLAAAEVRRVLAPGGQVILMEHVAPGQEPSRREGIVYRPAQDLAGRFERAGLRVVSSAPFRKSPSRFVHWVRLGRLPRALWGIAARMEPGMALRGKEAPVYRDQLVVLAG